MSINWKEIAKQNNMTYEEFGDELVIATMSYMGGRMKEEGANTMIVKIHPYKLTCEVKKPITNEEKAAAANFVDGLEENY